MPALCLPFVHPLSVKEPLFAFEDLWATCRPHAWNLAPSATSRVSKPRFEEMMESLRSRKENGRGYHRMVILLRRGNGEAVHEDLGQELEWEARDWIIGGRLSMMRYIIIVLWVKTKKTTAESEGGLNMRGYFVQGCEWVGDIGHDDDGHNDSTMPNDMTFEYREVEFRVDEGEEQVLSRLLLHLDSFPLSYLPSGPQGRVSLPHLNSQSTAHCAAVQTPPQLGRRSYVSFSPFS
ncbi:hypothetical protein FB451DRAFT_1186779 [Mycena latifolia]|nr:hypothetical protein FB451DRAFT_1186779 [Mycena latifolia]